MDNAGDNKGIIWAIIGVGIALASLMISQHNSLRQEHVALQAPDHE